MMSDSYCMMHMHVAIDTEQISCTFAEPLEHLFYSIQNGNRGQTIFSKMLKIVCLSKL